MRADHLTLPQGSPLPFAPQTLKKPSSDSLAFSLAFGAVKLEEEKSALLDWRQELEQERSSLREQLAQQEQEMAHTSVARRGLEQSFQVAEERWARLEDKVAVLHRDKAQLREHLLQVRAGSGWWGSPGR